MWLAHALTLSRIPLAVALAAAWGRPAWSVAIVGLAALTDTADGRVARRARRRGDRGPDIGGWLDPAVDKLFVAIVLAVIWVHAPLAHRTAVIGLIGARELVLVPLVAVYLAWRRPHVPLRADVFGKLATIAQFIALCVIALAPEHAVPAAVVAGVLGLVAAGHYVVTASRYPGP
ncbi:MAG TPA: CDP-alcohol phosphatidyltransferase family protein [Kofleriaceae bacterium]